MEEIFKNKIALISGAGRGIGKEIALALAEAGALPILISRTESELKDVVDYIKNKGQDADYFKCDIADEKQIKELIKKIINKYQKIDLLVNNAAIVGPKGKLEEVDLKQWQAVFDINLTGTFILTKAAVEQMKKNKGSTILNIGGGKDVDFLLPYCLTKNALSQFTKLLSEQLKIHNITVNEFNPGQQFKTKMAEGIWPDLNNLPEPYILRKPVLKALEQGLTGKTGQFYFYKND